MILFRSLRATALTIGVIGLGTAACQPEDRAAPQSASSEHYGGPFSEEEARAHAA